MQRTNLKLRRASCRLINLDGVTSSSEPDSAFPDQGDTAGREQAADERDRVADERDRLADLRDMLADARVRTAEDDLAGLRVAMDTRAIIEQAKGMIMITLKVDADAAFEVLVRRSQTSHQRLVDVARDIILTGLRGPERP